MHRDFEYSVGAVSYPCIAESADAFFGKGIKIEVFNKSGRLRGRVRFHCHPEFDEFADFQSKSHDELITIARDRLMTGAHEATLVQMHEHGMELLLRFNGIESDSKAVNCMHKS